MLTVETLSSIEALLTSDALTVKGSQLAFVFNVIQQIGQEKQGLLISQRAIPMPPTPQGPPDSAGSAQGGA